VLGGCSVVPVVGGVVEGCPHEEVLRSMRGVACSGVGAALCVSRWFVRSVVLLAFVAAGLFWREKLSKTQGRQKPFFVQGEKWNIAHRIA